MEESRLVDLLGILPISFLEENFIERDLKKGGLFKLLHKKKVWLAAGITAGSLAATGGILFAVRHKRMKKFA